MHCRAEEQRQEQENKEEMRRMLLQQMEERAAQETSNNLRVGGTCGEVHRRNSLNGMRQNDLGINLSLTCFNMWGFQSLSIRGIGFGFGLKKALGQALVWAIKKLRRRFGSESRFHASQPVPTVQEGEVPYHRVGFALEGGIREVIPHVKGTSSIRDYPSPSSGVLVILWLG